MRWKTARACAAGIVAVAWATTRAIARSFSVHSDSRRLRNPSAEGKVSLFSVVLILNTFTCRSSRRPMRLQELCRALCGGSMRLRVWRRVCTLWWWRRLRYEPSPTATDLWPPSMATRLRFT